MLKVRILRNISKPERNGVRLIGYNCGKMQIARVAKREKASAKSPPQLDARLWPTAIFIASEINSHR